MKVLNPSTSQKLGNVHSLVQILSNMPKSKSALFARISRLLSHARRVIMIVIIKTWSINLAKRLIFESHL